MRLVHITAGNLFGGIERMLLGIASARHPGCRHEFAVSYNGRLAKELRESGAAPRVLGDVRFRRPDTVWRARRALQAVIAEAPCDAVIAHAPWSCALAAPVARRAGVPIFLWVHDAPHADQWPERRVARLPPARVICNSGYTAGLVARWLPGVPRDVIHPPVSLPSPQAPRERRATRRELRMPDSTIVILLAARLEEWKGQRVLIEAAAQLRGDVAVWIAGGVQRPTDVEYFERLKGLAADPSSAGRVHLLGERVDVPKLMAAADIYCQPNTSPEPFGVAFVEALASGLPVVTTASGGALEIVDDRCGILVASPTAALVARALQRLVDHPALRETLGAAGPAQAALVSDPAARLQQIADIVRAHSVGSSAA